jgi:gliding motility-associated-like protein
MATIDTTLLQDAGGCDSLVIRTTAYAGVDTIRVQAETCDPASAGITITVRPGMPCDTLVQTTTVLVPTLTRRDTIEACGRGAPLTDTLRFTSSFGCDSLVYRTTIFNPLDPVVNLTDESCAGDADGSIQVVSVTGGTPPFSASLNNGPFIDGQDGMLPSFDDLPPGTYTVIVSDAAGCRDTTDNLLLQPGPSLSLSAGADMAAAPGTLIQLTGTASDPTGEWRWTATDPLSCDTCLLTMLGPLTTAQWAVLSGITPAGCAGMDSVFIRLGVDLNWSVPNVFSPNGDGINDVFRPAVSDETAVLSRIEIYDRWGGLLFALREAQPLSGFAGWDGTMNAQPVSPGVYVYVIEFSVPGQEGIRVAGDVTLLR